MTPDHNARKKYEFFWHLLFPENYHSKESHSKQKIYFLPFQTVPLERSSLRLHCDNFDSCLEVKQRLQSLACTTAIFFIFCTNHQSQSHAQVRSKNQSL